MPKYLADITAALGKLQLHYLLILLGFVGFLKVADTKNAKMPRETRKKFQFWSGALIGGGLLLAAYQIVMGALNV